jgi:hypothetical protein
MVGILGIENHHLKHVFTVEIMWMNMYRSSLFGNCGTCGGSFETFQNDRHQLQRSRIEFCGSKQIPLLLPHDRRNRPIQVRSLKKNLCWFSKLLYYIDTNRLSGQIDDNEKSCQLQPEKAKQVFFFLLFDDYPADTSFWLFSNSLAGNALELWWAMGKNIPIMWTRSKTTRRVTKSHSLLLVKSPVHLHWR